MFYEIAVLKNYKIFNKSAAMEYVFNKAAELNIKSCLKKDFIKDISV